MCLTMTISCGIWETLVGSKYTVYLPWESFVPGSADKAGNVEEGATTISLLVFFSYIIIFNTVVPISLYVRYVSLFTQKKSSTTRSFPSLSVSGTCHTLTVNLMNSGKQLKQLIFLL